MKFHDMDLWKVFDSHTAYLNYLSTPYSREKIEPASVRRFLEEVNLRGPAPLCDEVLEYVAGRTSPTRRCLVAAVRTLQFRSVALGKSMSKRLAFDALYSSKVMKIERRHLVKPGLPLESRLCDISWKDLVEYSGLHHG